MKTLINLFAGFMLIIIAQNLNAQSIKSVDGIFLTEQDYKSDKPSVCLDTKDRIQLNEFFAGKYVTVRCQGQITKLSKNDIYGYRLQSENFRLFNNEAYKIIDTSGFQLYSRKKLSIKGKGYSHVTKYFYSVGTQKPILNLTIENLLGSFPDQTNFRYSIQNSFYKDGDLMAYDKQAGQYKIKYLYFQHRQLKVTHTTL